MTVWIDLPHEPGWYWKWHRHVSNPEIIFVGQSDVDLFQTYGDFRVATIKYSGPLPIPHSPYSEPASAAMTKIAPPEAKDATETVRGGWTMQTNDHWSRQLRCACSRAWTDNVKANRAVNGCVQSHPSNVQS